MSENKTISKICITCMAFIIMVVFVLVIYAPFDKNKVSVKENRNLATKPKLTVKTLKNREFMLGVESFLGDHTMLRTDIVNVAGDMETKLKKNMDITVTKSSSKRKEIGSDYVILSDRIVALYIGEKGYTDAFVNGCKKIYNIVPRNVNKYMMISPTRIEFEDEKIKEYSDSEFEFSKDVYSKMPKNVLLIDGYSAMVGALEEHDINEIYFKTDHHWTHLGSYYNANTLMQALGMEPVDINDYDKIDRGGFRGYLAAMHEKESENIESDSLVYYNVATELTEKVYGIDGESIDKYKEGYVTDTDRAGYYMFVQGFYQYAVINGGNKNGDNILMIMDSYSNALVTWMAEQCNTIVLVDPRNYTGNKEDFLGLFEKYNINKFVINVAGLVGGSGYGTDMESIYK